MKRLFQLFDLHKESFSFDKLTECRESALKQILKLTEHIIRVDSLETLFELRIINNNCIKDAYYVPAVVTKLPLIIHIFFPSIHPSFTKAKKSKGNPIAASMNSTMARLMSTRL